MKKNIIIRIIIWLAIIYLIFIAFKEMFIAREISKSISFIELIHYQNRSDLLTFISIIVTSIISYNVYNLSKRINEQNNIEKSKNKYESACVVYDYLNEIVVYTKKIVFNDKEDYHELKYKDDFMKHAYNISKDILDESDMELIRKIDINLRTYLEKPDNAAEKKMIIKWLCKNIFDMNYQMKEIEDINNVVDVDLLLNPQLILVLSKLRKKLNYEYMKYIDYKDIKLIIYNNRNKIMVRKQYNKDYFIDNGTGTVEIHEPVFYANRKLYDNGAVIYKGEIRNYLPNGNGIYYYYKADYTKGISINSDDLIDKIAVRIMKILQNEGIDTRINLTINGKFYNGKILKGVIEFEDKKLGTMEVSENDYKRK